MDNVLIGAPDPEIVECEHRLRMAQLKADVAELGRLISDDLLFAGPDGRLASKAQDLEAYVSGAVRFLSHEPQELRIRRVGKDVAITSLQARLAVEVAGGASSGIYRYTRVWVHADGGWRVAGGHVSEVR